MAGALVAVAVVVFIAVPDVHQDKAHEAHADPESVDESENASRDPLAVDPAT